jgi:adenylosuccinate synthase
MANTVVIGMQWGDEGKGKIVDLLCPAFDVVARYQGGHNAGHTVKFRDRHFSLHLVPSGILHPGTRCVLGNGMVISPEALFGELNEIAALGVAVDDLFVSDRAHVLLPVHRDLDLAREQALGRRKVGTTGRGIGPAYEAKASRLGLRTADLFAGDLEERLRMLLLRAEAELVSLGGSPIGHPSVLADHCRRWTSRLRPLLRDTAQLLLGWIDEGKSVLFEGAQGTLLDLDHGTYPYVTSSSSTAGGACTGTGVPPTRIDGVLGVVKAYSTRVGGGPFVTEIGGTVEEYLRHRGNEFGTTTGRPRRCGWLDLVALRWACRLNDTQCIALTKLDVLDELPEIPVCVGYRHRGQVLRELPADLDALGAVEPVYRAVKGWETRTVGMLDYGELPAAARGYVELIEQELGVPVSILSTGPRREETMVRDSAVLSRLTSDRLAAVLDAR